MSWYNEAIFYHIYPLGLSGAPKQNDYSTPVHRLNTLLPWIDHIKAIGCTALYIGPLFESVGHGYETTDYKKLDSRLGTNENLTAFVKVCHEKGIKVIFDGVFNHTGRDFFAFKDIQKNREHSPYLNWYCNVNFYGNNEYNDGFSYDNWGGYNLLVKLNQRNPDVQNYICDVIRYWVSEFDAPSYCRGSQTGFLADGRGYPRRLQPLGKRRDAAQCHELRASQGTLQRS